jgi:hypothetical protein
MKVLSLAAAFVFAALAVAGPVDGSSGNKLAERQVGTKFIQGTLQIMFKC